MNRTPNVVFVFADQLRRDATGFGGNPNIRTPCMDQLAAQGTEWVNAISGIPVCCPARASLMTGLYPHRHGVVINDVHLDDRLPCFGRLFRSAGYQTAYIGKWHLNGGGRKAPVPRACRGGFDYWKAMECSHDYNASDYYDGDDPGMKRWEGYDALAQAEDAAAFIRAQANQPAPFLLVLSWGPPHDPYGTAPARFVRQVPDGSLRLRGNVPQARQPQAQEDYRGYLAHVLALDHGLGLLERAIEAAGIREDTIVVFWSDHGDMLHSHGEVRKQRPWDESIRVPLVMRYPRVDGGRGRKVPALINTPDLLPTLLGACRLPIPASLQGLDYSPCLRGENQCDLSRAALLASYAPFGEYGYMVGGKEYRGLRTERYTYVKDLAGPWLLYDNLADPLQMQNLVNTKKLGAVQADLEEELQHTLRRLGDGFQPGATYAAPYLPYLNENGEMPIDDFLQ